MHQFKRPLTQGEDTSTGLPALGFEVKDMLIHDPFLSECGRFTVDPVAAYGISVEDAQALKQQNIEFAASWLLQHVLRVRGEWQGYTWNPYAISQPAKPLPKR